ncbi:MAG TPA: Trk system potassium transporter TrkA [Limnochordia bacterium]|nr:Trk system potassium transporter TrkA [Limnochordia bacterium]
MDILIVGMGKLGYKLAETLAGPEHDVTVVDLDEQALARAVNRLDVLPVKGNGAQLQLLEDLGVRKKDLVVAVTSSDETNVLICLTAKKLGCPRVAARVRNPEYAGQIDFYKEQLQLDFITNPELDTANEVARYLLRGYSAHLESFAGGRVGLFEVPASAVPGVVGRTLAAVDAFQDMLVGAIYRSGEVIIPSGATVVESEDVLHLIGRREAVTALIREHSSLGQRHVAKRVMILGGGKAAFYLASRLLTSGLSVKIIEQDEERCNYLAAQLPGALVICGDGTDLDLLQDENLSEMDALVSFTGHDEENLMLALLGKQHGVGKVVAKVSRSNFVPIIEELGIDRAVNPVLISAGELVRFIQGGQIASLSLIFGGQAEVMEFVVPPDAPIIGVKLAEARIPPGVILGSIVRRGQVFIPKGDFVVQAQDRVIAFCLHRQLPELNKLFYPKRRGLGHELWFGRKGSGKHSAD